MRSETRSISDDLLAWYDVHARDLPWRLGPDASKSGQKPDPYRVWLSEIMLQQTTVAAVKPFFERFVNRWPSIADLGRAEQSDVMSAWAGLGYYSRARNLHACARTVTEEMGGRFPRTARELKALPGIGDYTSAAIASIAFGEVVPVVDGNIERVVTRLRRIAAPLPAAKPKIREEVALITSGARPGDFAQAMMDLGATICTPRSPQCLLCPIAGHCEARAEGDQALYPVKAPKRAVPSRRGAAFVAIRRVDGAVFLRRRPETGMLGGMAEAPSTNWSASCDGIDDASGAPFEGRWSEAGVADHGFTHFKLRLVVFRAVLDESPETDGWWAPSETIADQGLPTLMRKVVEIALSKPVGMTEKGKRSPDMRKTVSRRLEAEPSDRSTGREATGTMPRSSRPVRRRVRRTSDRYLKR